MGNAEKPFLTGEAAEDRLRVVYSGLGPDYVERIVVSNGVLDEMLNDLGIDPATMQMLEGGE